MWRPGCPFCYLLRRGLKRAGIATTEVNIWENPEAAARVREAAGGNETVPTVFVAGQALVNPPASAVVELLHSLGAGSAGTTGVTGVTG